MSYCALCTVDLAGDVHEDKEYRNAHGGVAFIWNAMCKRYNICDEYGYYGSEAWGHLWKRVREDEGFRRSLKEWELFTLYFSYDNAMVSRKYFEKLADSLQAFYDDYYKPQDQVVCHLASWARDIRNYLDDMNVYAVCLHAISVNENPWYEYDEEDEYVSYNINTGTKHWFLPEDMMPREE